MAQKVVTKDLILLARLCPVLKKLPVQRMNLRYDEEADVLYVKFADTKPIHSSKLTRDDILIEYDAKKNVVGYTILDASSR
jgi:uncharacterized protein YuzE